MQLNKLRRMIITAGAGGPGCWRLAAAAALLFVLQVAAVSHLVGHAATGESAGCLVCASAAETGHSLPSAGLTPAVAPLADTLTAEDCPRLISGRFLAAYRSRAPPRSV